MEVRERIRINAKPLSKERFAKYYFELDELLSLGLQRNPHLSGQPPPNYFRFLTLMSFYVFIKEEVTSAIYETGVGGEHDATNVLVHPSVTGITALGYDHLLTLGNDIRSISRHKAGIFKRFCPAFSVHQEYTEASEELVRKAQELDISLSFVAEDAIADYLPDWPRQGWANAALALALVQEYLRCHQRSLRITGKELAKVIREGQPPGRYHIFHNDQGTWYLDGAHTKESLRSTAEWFSAQRLP